MQDLQLDISEKLQTQFVPWGTQGVGPESKRIKNYPGSESTGTPHINQGNEAGKQVKFLPEGYGPNEAGPRLG
eukprot:589303-Pelagomonas_calceolata.AAC.2